MEPHPVTVPGASRKAESVTGRYRVLVVDDDPFVLQIAQELLEEAGYDVGTAENGVEGAWKFLRGEWDVVIADRMMPRLSGEEMTASIKAEDPDVPVILLTGVTRNVQQMHWYSAVVVKPFDALSLVGPVNEVIRKRYSDSEEDPHRASTAAGAKNDK